MEVNPFSGPWRRKLLPLILNNLLENALVCAYFPLKLACGT